MRSIVATMRLPSARQIASYSSQAAPKLSDWARNATRAGDGVVGSPERDGCLALAQAIESIAKKSQLAVERSTMNLKRILSLDAVVSPTVRSPSFFRRYMISSLCTLALLLAPRTSVAQLSAERSARATVDTFFALVTREKWDSAAALLDLARFEPYFKGVLRNMRSAIPPRPTTAEDLMANDSTMPRAVAEWQIGRMKAEEGHDPFDYVTYEFGGISASRDLFTMPIPTAAARWLEGQDGRTMMRTAWRKQGCSLADLPDFPAAKRTVLAIALANDSTAYVIHTDDRFGDADPGNLFFGERVMRLHRSAARWRIEPRRDLLNPGNTAFSVGFDCPKSKRP